MFNHEHSLVSMVPVCHSPPPLPGLHLPFSAWEQYVATATHCDESYLSQHMHYLSAQDIAIPNIEFIYQQAFSFSFSDKKPGREDKLLEGFEW